ncbi:Rhs element Vgr protein [Pseudomonas plecoglossicida]|nr:Rhs element Vgr protein [Pseudomonas plecoglossicida]
MTTAGFEAVVCFAFYFNTGPGEIAENSGVPLKSMLGQHVSIEIELAEGGPRYITGYLTRFASIGSDGGMARYTATLNPWFSMLKNRFDTRIFQGNTVEEVVTECSPCARRSLVTSSA